MHTVVLSDTLCQLIHKVQSHGILRIDENVRFVDCNDDPSVRVVLDVEIAVFDDLVIEPFEHQKHLRVGNDSVFVGKQTLEIEHCKVFFDRKRALAVPEICVSAFSSELGNVIMQYAKLCYIILHLRLCELIVDQVVKVVEDGIIAWREVCEIRL